MQPLAMLFCDTFTAQKMKFSIKNFFSKCDQILRKLRIWSHLLKKSLMGNRFFCAVFFSFLPRNPRRKGGIKTPKFNRCIQELDKHLRQSFLAKLTNGCNSQSTKYYIIIVWRYPKFSSGYHLLGRFCHTTWNMKISRISTMCIFFKQHCG